MPLDLRQRDLLNLLWREGRLSRWELHQRTGVNPNATGADVAALVSAGLVRECPAEPQGPGRPRVPLEIDPISRQVLGLAIRPGYVEAARLNLRGHLVGKPVQRAIEDSGDIPRAAVDLINALPHRQALAVGLAATGFLDPARQRLLFSSAVPNHQPVSLETLCRAAGDKPILLENDMHALAARWLLTHQAESDEDVLLVHVLDGQLGAAMLIGGRPNRGCIVGGNELGHLRFFVPTEQCYCGHEGCLERICSSAFLQRLSGGEGTLMQRAASFRGNDAALEQMAQYLAMGLANAANLIRPNRLVLVSELTRYAPFSDLLLRHVRGNLLYELAERVRLEVWDQPAATSAETAGWLALAALYCRGWEMMQVRPEEPGAAEGRRLVEAR